MNMFPSDHCVNTSTTNDIINNNNNTLK